MTQAVASTGAMTTRLPRLGFLGVGWIGRQRMSAVSGAGACEVVSLADPAPAALADAAREAPGAVCVATTEELLDSGLDGLVIATPSALHAQQAITALERGIAVFCQKPLARTAAETRRVIDAASRANRLLGIDYSYRFASAFAKVLQLVRSGDLGRVFAADLVFHNAYGPDKAWFKDPALSGGGCLIDLGVHLVDLALLAFGGPASSVSGQLFAKGRALQSGSREVEDFAIARFTAGSGARVQLTCSWWLHAGQDAVIEARFHGSRAGACVRNINGSFTDFIAERYEGTKRQVLAEAPDDWGGRAIIAWARQLAKSPQFDPDVESTIDVAEVLDKVYQQ